MKSELKHSSKFFKNVTFRELRSKGRKKCWSNSQKFWLEVSLYLTAPLARTRMTPNFVSSFGIILQIFAAILFTLGGYWYNISAIFLFNFVSYLFDHIDGNLARMKEQFSSLGPYLEQLAIFFGTPLIFLGLAIGNYYKNNEALFLFFSLVGILFWLFEKLIRINPVWFNEDKQEKLISLYRRKVSFRSKKGLQKIFIELTRRGQPFNLLFFLVVFDYTQAASLIYSTLFTLEFFRKLTSTILNLKKLDKRD
jgi:phosphatidylglycerophosphate synthase